MSLVEKLQHLQGERNQDEFAAHLGISQGTLSRIYAGKRQLGQDVAAKIARRHPELAFDLAAFLLTTDIPTEQDELSA
ncbi:MAG: helix-turn-helix transcriptional regulator [Phycisphaerales bacterium]|jgi:plasmid maintenance system antidote protein VapI